MLFTLWDVGGLKGFVLGEGTSGPTVVGTLSSWAVNWFNLVSLFMKFIRRQTYVSKPWPTSTVCLRGV